MMVALSGQTSVVMTAVTLGVKMEEMLAVMLADRSA